MRIACVMVPNLPVQVALMSHPSLRGKPVVVGGLPFEAKPVYDASPQAIACGIRVGMPLREAYALCPRAKFLPADETQYKQVFEHVAGVLEGFSPTVEIGEIGWAYIDVSGVRDEMSLCLGLLRSISAETGLSACLGASSGKIFSYIAALTSKPGVPVIVKPGQEKKFVAPFPIDLLPCSEESKERLRLLGIRLIGELARFTKEALVAQFGSEGSLIYDLAHGIDRSFLSPRAKPETISNSFRLDYPAVSLIEILQACEIMLGKLLTRVNSQGKLCREVTISLGFAMGDSEEQRLVLKEPTASGRKVLSRLRAHLETQRLPSPVVKIGLSLLLTGERAKKLPLWPGKRKAGEGLTKVAEELKLRFGWQPIKRLQTVSPRPILPERQFILTDLLE